MTTRARAKATAPAQRHTGRTVAGTALFVVGFSAVFALAGLAVGGLGQLFSAHDSALTRVLGGVTILLGLLFFGAFDRFTFAGRIFKPSAMPRAGLAGAPLLGVLFGIGWTPCIGPTLTAVLTLSLQSGTAARGAFLAFVYGLGLGIPFLIVALAFQRLVQRAQLLQAQRPDGQPGRRRHAGGRRPARGDRRVDVGGQLAAHPLVQRLQHAAVVRAPPAVTPRMIPNGRAASPPGSAPPPYRRLPARGFTATGLRGTCGSAGRAGRGLRRRLDEGGHQPRVVALFRVPLDADAEAVARHLKRLGDLAVGRPAGHRQPVAQLVRGLVVRGGHLDLGAEQPAEQAVTGQRPRRAACTSPGWAGGRAGAG